MNAHSMSEFTGTDKTYLTMPYFQKSQNNTHGLIEAHIFDAHISKLALQNGRTCFPRDRFSLFLHLSLEPMFLCFCIGRDNHILPVRNIVLG